MGLAAAPLNGKVRMCVHVCMCAAALLLLQPALRLYPTIPSAPPVCRQRLLVRLVLLKA